MPVAGFGSDGGGGLVPTWERRGPVRAPTEKKGDRRTRAQPDPPSKKHIDPAAHLRSTIRAASDEAIARDSKDMPSGVGDEGGAQSAFAFTRNDIYLSDYESDGKVDHGDPDPDTNAKYRMEPCFADLMSTRNMEAKPTWKRTGPKTWAGIPKRRTPDATTAKKRRRAHAPVLRRAGRSHGNASSPKGKSISRSGDSSGEEEARMPIIRGEHTRSRFRELRSGKRAIRQETRDLEERSPQPTQAGGIPIVGPIR